MGYKPKLVITHNTGQAIAEAVNSGTLYSPIGINYAAAHDAALADSVENDTSVWIEQEFVESHYNAWLPHHTYPAGNRVEPTTPNGYYYQSSGGVSNYTTEPIWPTVWGQTVIDNTITWTCVADYTTDYWLNRGGIKFLVPTGITVISASIFLFGEDFYSDEGDFDLTLVSGSDLVDPLVVADYGELLDEVTSYGSINTASWSLEGWNELALNAAGLVALQAAISSGVFSIGLRHSSDISDTAPTAESYVIAYGSNATSSISKTYCQVHIIG